MQKAIKKSDEFSDKDAIIKQYLTAASGKSNTHAREIAKEILGEEIFWNWDCRLIFLVFCDDYLILPQCLVPAKVTTIILAELR